MKTSTIGLFVSLLLFLCTLLFMRQCAAINEKTIEYKGILIEIFIDENNRSEYTYKIQSSQGYVNLTIKSYPKSYNYIEVGDSVIKKKNELQIMVKKKKSNFQTSVFFPYMTE